MSENCELCILDRINHVFYNCDDFIIMSCDSCHVPMAVTHEHIDPTEKPLLTTEEKNKYLKIYKNMSNQLYIAAYDFFGDFNFYIDKKQRKIPNHVHWHARKLNEALCGNNLFSVHIV